MTWVPRTPMRPDFCGCPPCPWCYAWAGDDLCDGVTKMARDLLGGNPTPVQVMQLEAGAQLVHANNLARREADLIREQEARQAEDEKWSEREANAFLAEKRKQVARPVAKIDTRPTLDELSQEELERRTKPPAPEPSREWVPITLGANPYKSYIEKMYRMQQADLEKVMFGPVAITGIDWAADELKPKKAENQPKWGGGDVKERAEKEARKQRDALLRR